MSAAKRGPGIFAGGGCFLLFGLPFLASGVFVIFMFVVEMSAYRRAASWERVPVRIESVQLDVSHGKGTSYSVDATYRYEYGGRTYVGTRVSPDTGGSSDARHVERHRELNGHKESGQPFTGWVNPRNPEESMLYREVTAMSWAMLPFGLVFSGVGGAMVFGGIVGLRRRRRRAAALARDPGRPWRADPRWADGFVVGERAGSTLASFWIGSVIFTAFLSVFVIGFVGNGAYFVLLALAPFLIVDAVLCWMTVQRTARFLKYGSPRLALAEMPAVPGRELVGIVLCRRHVAPEGSFTVTLKCERGTDVVYKDIVRVTGDLAEDRAGTAIPVRIAVPADEAPTDAGSDPAVGWKLLITAETPGVDFETEFELPVFGVADERLIEKRPEGHG